MTRERFYVGAYWGARVASSQHIAEYLSATLRELGACHLFLEQWNQKADTYDEALRLVVEPTPETLEPLLTTNEPEHPTRFGYDLWLWNGRENSAEQCKLHINSGIVSTIPDGLSNHFILHLTGNPDSAPDLHSPAVMLQLLEIMVRKWRPDWAVAMSDEYLMRHARGDDRIPVPGKPRVGWMTYLRAERLGNLPADVPCKTVDIDGRGTIFIVTDEHRFSVENPDDVARALALTAFLAEHGALATIPLNVPM